ncbi:MAG: hypothetical protein WCP45_10610 [Verrucomicrobiota bacterium]
MKRLQANSGSPRYSGGMRASHRATSRNETWDEWVNGEMPPALPRKNWLKIGLVILALLALAGIMVALVLEMRWS